MFIPDAHNGWEARQRVLHRLRESLEHVFQASDGILDFDARAAARLLTSLADNQPQKPALFAHYFDLVTAIQAGEHERAQTILSKLLALPSGQAGPPSVLRFARDAIDAETLDLILRHVSVESIDGAGLTFAEPEEAAPRRLQVERALNRLSRHVPELFGELRETVSEIVLGKGVSGKGYMFDGASSLEYWGAILINVSIAKSDLEVVEMIAHEAAHNVLFGMSPAEFFVTNPDSDLFESPLRDDPRPLDGIYHATFVLARMHHVIERLRQAGGLEPGERDEAERLLSRSAKNFRDGLAVLEANADYTSAGKTIMDDCVRYMSGRAEAA